MTAPTILTIGVLAILVCVASAASVFIDEFNGDDLNDGRTSGTPVKTMTAVLSLREAVEDEFTVHLLSNVFVSFQDESVWGLFDPPANGNTVFVSGADAAAADQERTLFLGGNYGYFPPGSSASSNGLPFPAVDRLVRFQDLRVQFFATTTSAQNMNFEVHGDLEFVRCIVGWQAGNNVGRKAPTFTLLHSALLNLENSHFTIDSTNPRHRFTLQDYSTLRFTNVTLKDNYSTGATYSFIEIEESGSLYIDGLEAKDIETAYYLFNSNTLISGSSSVVSMANVDLSLTYASTDTSYIAGTHPFWFNFLQEFSMNNVTLDISGRVFGSLLTATNCGSASIVDYYLHHEHNLSNHNEFSTTAYSHTQTPFVISAVDGDVTVDNFHVFVRHSYIHSSSYTDDMYFARFEAASHALRVDKIFIETSLRTGTNERIGVRLLELKSPTTVAGKVSLKINRTPSEVTASPARPCFSMVRVPYGTATFEDVHLQVDSVYSVCKTLVSTQSTVTNVIFDKMTVVMHSDLITDPSTMSSRPQYSVFAVRQSDTQNYGGTASSYVTSAPSPVNVVIHELYIPGSEDFVFDLPALDTITYGAASLRVDKLIPTQPLTTANPISYPWVTTVIDAEVTCPCGGDCNSLEGWCRDCAGTPGGSAVEDLCGVCGGSNDCLDDCVATGTCVEGDSCGDASHYDRCGECVADASPELLGATCTQGSTCTTTAGSKSTFDRCGVCAGDSSSCAAGAECESNTTFWRSLYDKCGHCDGDGSACDHGEACTTTYGRPSTFDACGICGGDSSSCMQNLPCILPGSGVSSYFDKCSVCGGGGASCVFEAVCNTPTTAEAGAFDLCGDCIATSAGAEAIGAACSSGKSCFRVDGTAAVFDSCGVCGGNSDCLVTTD